MPIFRPLLISLVALAAAAGCSIPGPSDIATRASAFESTLPAPEDECQIGETGLFDDGTPWTCIEVDDAGDSEVCLADAEDEPVSASLNDVEPSLNLLDKRRKSPESPLPPPPPPPPRVREREIQQAEWKQACERAASAVGYPASVCGKIRWGCRTCRQMRTGLLDHNWRHGANDNETKAVLAAVALLCSGK